MRFASSVTLSCSFVVPVAFALLSRRSRLPQLVADRLRLPRHALGARPRAARRRRRSIRSRRATRSSSATRPSTRRSSSSLRCRSRCCPSAVASWLWFCLLGVARVRGASGSSASATGAATSSRVTSPVVVHGLFYGNLTVLLVLPLALAWRYRDRARRRGLAVGIAVAAKLFVWPLVVWLLLTRRFRAAAWAVGSVGRARPRRVGADRLRGLRDYPALLRAVQDVYAVRSVSLSTVAGGARRAGRRRRRSSAAVAGIACLAVAAWLVAADGRRPPRLRASSSRRASSPRRSSGRTTPRCSSSRSRSRGRGSRRPGSSGTRSGSSARSRRGRTCRRSCCRPRRRPRAGVGVEPHRARALVRGGHDARRRWRRARPGDRGALATRRRSAGRGGDAVTTSDSVTAGRRHETAVPSRPEAGDRVDSLPTSLVHAPAVWLAVIVGLSTIVRVAIGLGVALPLDPARRDPLLRPRAEHRRRRRPRGSWRVHGRLGRRLSDADRAGVGALRRPRLAVPRGARDQRARHVECRDTRLSPGAPLRSAARRGGRRAADGARAVDGVHRRRHDGERLLSDVPLDDVPDRPRDPAADGGEPAAGARGHRRPLRDAHPGRGPRRGARCGDRALRPRRAARGAPRVPRCGSPRRSSRSERCSSSPSRCSSRGGRTRRWGAGRGRSTPCGPARCRSGSRTSWAASSSTSR